MISDENLKQLRDMMAGLLEEYGLKKPAERQKGLNAERQRRFRERNATRNAKVTLQGRKRNATSNAPVTVDAVAHIPIIGGGEYGVSKALLAELEKAYPVVDGPATLLEVRAWCITNPDKRKTARGVPRFLNSWFERIQNKG